MLKFKLIAMIAGCALAQGALAGPPPGGHINGGATPAGGCTCDPPGSGGPSIGPHPHLKPIQSGIGNHIFISPPGRS